MQVTRQGSLVLVELELVAPIPVGHLVTVIALGRDDAGWLDASAAEAVLDATSGTLYADYTYWLMLQQRGWPAEPPSVDPVGALGGSWRAKQSFQGRVRGAMVSTKDGGEQNHARTLLHLAPPDAEPSYRG